MAIVSSPLQSHSFPALIKDVIPPMCLIDKLLVVRASVLCGFGVFPGIIVSI